MSKRWFALTIELLEKAWAVDGRLPPECFASFTTPAEFGRGGFSVDENGMVPFVTGYKGQTQVNSLCPESILILL